MPSPIAHSAVGLAICMLGGRRLPPLKKLGPLPIPAVATIGYSLLPDVDSLAGLLAGDFGRYHNNLTHSLFVGVVASALASVLIGRYYDVPRRPWFWLTLLAYWLHIFMDANNVGRGVMAFWPLTAERFKMPISLFYGFHWSDGLISIRHLWTFLTELLFALVVLGLSRRIQMRQQADDVAVN